MRNWIKRFFEKVKAEVKVKLKEEVDMPYKPVMTDKPGTFDINMAEQSTF